MKTKLAIAALALVLPSLAIAYNPQGDVMTCSDIAHVGQRALEERKRGASYVRVSSATPTFKALVTKAYEYPEEYLDKSTFLADLFLLCMDGGMEFDSGELVILD